MRIFQLVYTCVRSIPHDRQPTARIGRSGAAATTACAASGMRPWVRGDCRLSTTVRSGHLIHMRAGVIAASLWSLATLNLPQSPAGVISDERWTMVDAADDLSWAVFQYSGAASVVGQSYTGASPHSDYTQRLCRCRSMTIDEDAVVTSRTATRDLPYCDRCAALLGRRALAGGRSLWS